MYCLCLHSRLVTSNMDIGGMLGVVDQPVTAEGESQLRVSVEPRSGATPRFSLSLWVKTNMFPVGSIGRNPFDIISTPVMGQSTLGLVTFARF